MNRWRVYVEGQEVDSDACRPEAEAAAARVGGEVRDRYDIEAAERQEWWA